MPIASRPQTARMAVIKALSSTAGPSRPSLSSRHAKPKEGVFRGTKPRTVEVEEKPEVEEKEENRNDIKTVDEDEYENDENVETIDEIRQQVHQKVILWLEFKSREEVLHVNDDVIIESLKPSSKPVSRFRKQGVSYLVDVDDVITESPTPAFTLVFKSKK